LDVDDQLIVNIQRHDFLFPNQIILYLSRAHFRLIY